MSLIRKYCENFCEQNDYLYASPRPANELHLGTYGELHNKVFYPAGRLDALPGWTIPLTEGPASEDTDEWETYGDFKAATFKAGANVGSGDTAVNAGFSIEFEDRFAYVVRMIDVDMVELTSRHSVMHELHRRAHLDQHDPDYWDHGRFRVITSLVRTKNILVALSRKSKGEIGFEAKVSAAEIDLADANLEFGVKWGHEAAKVITGPVIADSTPKYYTPAFYLWHVYREMTKSGVQLTRE